MLVQVIDVSSTEGRDPIEDFKVITRELALFPGRDSSGERLQDKPIVVAANKIDALDDPERLDRLRQHLKGIGVPLYPVSAATGDGLPLLLEAVWKKLAANTVRAIEDRGSKIDDGASLARDRGSRIETRGSRFEDR